MNETVPLSVLLGLIEPIEATGGVFWKRDSYRPVADPDWSDLGDAYVAACSAIGREPVIEKVPDYECEDCDWSGPPTELVHDSGRARCPACGSPDVG